MKKATRGQVRQHNRQLVLRSVYTGTATSRAALAQLTGLTKPAISTLVETLLNEGFLVEEGFGESTDIGGKRPRLLRFIPDARQVIGIAVEATRVIGVLTNLDGEVIASHNVETPTADQAAPLAPVMSAINGLIAQAHAPLLCIGVGMTGDTELTGSIRAELDSALRARYAVPVHLANSSELTALAQYMFGDNDAVDQLVTLVIGENVGIGVVLDGAAHHFGGDIGHLIGKASRKSRQNAEDFNSLLGWDGVQARVTSRRASETPLDSYLQIGWAATRKDSMARRLRGELADSVAQLCAWIITLMRPDHISITGMIGDLGDDFARLVSAKTRMLTLPELVDQTSFSVDATRNLAAIGAAALAIQMEIGLV